MTDTGAELRVAALQAAVRYLNDRPANIELVVSIAQRFYKFLDAGQ